MNLIGVLAAVAGCVWWLVRRRSVLLRGAGWFLAVLLVLLASLIILTQGSSVNFAPGIDDLWDDGWYQARKIVPRN